MPRQHVHTPLYPIGQLAQSQHMAALPNWAVMSPRAMIHLRRAELAGRSGFPEEAIKTAHYPGLSSLPHYGRKVVEAAQLVGSRTAGALSLHPELGRRRDPLRRHPASLKAASPSGRLCAQPRILSEPGPGGTSLTELLTSQGAGLPSPGRELRTDESQCGASKLAAQVARSMPVGPFSLVPSLPHSSWRNFRVVTVGLRYPANAEQGLSACGRSETSVLPTATGDCLPIPCQRFISP